MVCLDLSEMDSILIRYSTLLKDKLGLQEIHFIHVIKDFDVPHEVMNEFPELDQPLDELILSDLTETIQDVFEGSPSDHVTQGGGKRVDLISNKSEQNPCAISIHVESGNALEQLLRKAKELEVDLTLVGKKTSYKGTGLILGTLASFISSSVLFIPEQISFRLERLIVAVDFTEASELALKRAVQISSLTNAHVDACHVFELPSQFFPSTVPVEQLEDSARKSLKQKVTSFMNKVESHSESVAFDFILGEGRSLADVLYHEFIQKQSDLLLIGSKSRSIRTALYKGSIGEKLANPTYSIPVYIVKDKKQSKQIWEGLF